MARQLATVPGVVGVMLGGSHARGTADEASDIDLGIFYRAAQRPELETLRAVARSLAADGADSLTGYGEWGPWIEGGAWLTVDGVRVDWLYREIERIERVVEDCRVGRIVSAYQPGHPHGFHSHIHFAEAALGLILEDDDGELALLQARTTPYPEALRREIARSFSWQARFALEIAAKPALRGDVAYVSGCLFSAAASLVQVLFALNRAPLANEKGALSLAAALPLVPAQFAERVERSLSLRREPAVLKAALDELRLLSDEVERLALGEGLVTPRSAE